LQSCGSPGRLAVHSCGRMFCASFVYSLAALQANFEVYSLAALQANFEDPFLEPPTHAVIVEQNFERYIW
jgi:hypothetical protein